MPNPDNREDTLVGFSRLLLTAAYPPEGPALFHVCRPCFTLREPCVPRTCVTCRYTTCAHVACGCGPEHYAVPHLAVPIIRDSHLLIVVPG